ncbi:MAG: type III pantothenate kinase [Planctomycetia bacterium]|nr:type III pantothenate kinase [Planctomycetia bacterium]
MTATPTRPLIAVDVGNSRIKLGWFEHALASDFPLPDRTLRLTLDALDWTELDDWLGGVAPAELDWRLGSVNRAAQSRLIDLLRERGAIANTMLLAAGDLPLRVDLPLPDMVGVDRLLDAVAANRLRPADRAAVVVDLGTAITVDLVSADGAFQGGAILPGLMTSAKALNQFTDMLPLLAELDGAPNALGKSTLEAMRSGLFWGAVGGIRELVARYTEQLAAQPVVIVAGGSSHVVADLLGNDARHEPHLTLAGIALAARGADERSV